MSTPSTIPYPTITRRAPATSLVEGRFKVPNGIYIVTIHNERVVKIASVDRPVVLEMEAAKENETQKETPT